LYPQGKALSGKPRGGGGQRREGLKFTLLKPSRAPNTGAAHVYTLPMARSPKPQEGAPLPPTYEAALQELEGLVARLDAGQLPLDDLLTQYRRGEALLGFCRDKLEAVERQIQVVDGGQSRPWVDTP
jgi:exodeoxyribonuclease VII small subunit